MSRREEKNAEGVLDGKIAVVTGAASGIGLATARLFAAEGAKVVIVDRASEEQIEAARKSIEGETLGVRTDITRPIEIDALIERVQTTYGRIDIFYANAGVVELAPLGEITENTLNRQVEVNFKGTIFSVQKSLPLMPDGSAIVLTTSSMNVRGINEYTVYSATKAAVRSFTRTWARELGPRGIRVNAIAPGPIDTPILRSSSFGKESGAEIMEASLAMLPLGRLGRPEEIAEAALFLASDRSSYVTGVELPVDGGFAET
jgi:NAD(P)-dependent dehydrogenase (short-subunit alcohol dehydrogenase family)